MALLVLLAQMIPGHDSRSACANGLLWLELEWRRNVQVIGAFLDEVYERVLESTSKPDTYSEAEVVRATCWVVALLVLSSSMSLFALMLLFRMLAAPCLLFQAGLRDSFTQTARDRLLQQVAPEFELDELAVQKMRIYNEGSPSVCVICLDQFAASDRVRRVNCSHMYHATCYLRWFRVSMRCPLCNVDASLSLVMNSAQR